MAIEEDIKNAIAKEKAIIGTKEVTKALKAGKVKKVVVANNTMESVAKDMEHYQKVSGIEVAKFSGTGKQLGVFCGKPFAISVLAIKK